MSNNNTNGTLNNVTLIGFLGGNPEIRYTSTGTAVATMRLATNRRAKDKILADWHRVVLWGKVAENAVEYLSKGRKVMVQGEMRTRSWEKDGVVKYMTEVHCQSFSFMDSPKEKTNDEDIGVPQEEDTKQQTEGHDDLPSF